MARFIAAGQVTIVQQLVKAGPAPVFGPVKNGKPRTITLMAKTAELFHNR
jgi:hypothetical protein